MEQTEQRAVAPALYAPLVPCAMNALSPEAKLQDFYISKCSRKVLHKPEGHLRKGSSSCASWSDGFMDYFKRFENQMAQVIK